MVHAQAFDLVQWYENPRQEQLVFFLQRQRKPIDDRTKNF